MEQVSKEAEKWMKENAQWRDRVPGTKKDNPKGTKGYAKNKYDRTHHARQGLTVTITSKRQDELDFASGLGEAESKDLILLGKINAQRKKDWLAEQEILANKIAAKAGKKKSESSGPTSLTKRTKTDFQDMMFNKVPANLSNVKAYEKEFERTRIPIATLRFRQDPRISYSVWLEVAMGGRFSIIAPAVAYWYPKTQQRVKNNLNLIQYRNASFRSDVLGNIARVDESLFDEQGSFAEAVRTYEGTSWKGEGKKYLPFDERRKTRRSANQRTYDIHGRPVYDY